MTDKPILMAGPMVCATLREIEAPGTGKTNTRRILDRLPDVRETSSGWQIGSAGPVHRDIVKAIRLAEKCDGKTYLPYQPGDRLFPAIKIPSLSKSYCADVQGDIWSRRRGVWHRLTGSPNSKGYLTVTPAVRRRYPTRTIHNLVCEAFYGLAPDGMTEVRHLDGDHLNNAPDNLDWGTANQNRRDRNAHGRVLGEEHPASKLSAADVEQIRSSSASQRALAAQFGVSQSTIGEVRTGKTWNGDHEQDPPNFERWTEPCALYVTDVRVERVREISEEDARAEGPDRCLTVGWVEGESNPVRCYEKWRNAFRHLWNDIHGSDAWDRNDWVAAVTFTPRLGNVDSLPLELAA